MSGDPGAVRKARFDSEFSAEFGDALAHRCDADAGPPACGQADAVVAHVHADVVIHVNAHGASGGVCVSGHVGQGLGHYPVAGHLDRRREAGQAITGNLKADRQRGSLALETPHLLAQRPSQAEPVEHGWPQPVHYPADLGHGPLCLRFEPAQQLLEIWLTRRQRVGGVEAQR